MHCLGEHDGDIPNSLKAPSTTLVNATVHYDGEELRLQANVGNGLDNAYVGATLATPQQDFVQYGPSRSITARIRYRW